MAYKTVLTALTKDDGGMPGLDAAMAFSEAHEAHIEALCFGIDHAYSAYHYGSASLEILQASQDEARRDAMTLRKAVSARIDASGVEGTARAVVAGTGGIGEVIADRGRLADIAVLPQADSDERPKLGEMLLEATLFAAHLPVLLAPPKAKLQPWPDRIAIGWDDGPQALAALRAAMPLLRRASEVDLVVIDPPRHAPERPDPGHDVSLMLSRHGVQAEVVVLAQTLPRISDMLMRHAVDRACGLVVMGAYGHSRFQQTVFGGTTRRMLSETEVPLLLAR